MTLDEALVNVSHAQSTSEYHYGKQDVLWEKAASIASLKLNRVVSVSEAIQIHLALLEAKVSIKPSNITNIIDIMALYSLLTAQAQTVKVEDETLAKIEHDLMQSLAPPDDDHAQG